MIRDIAIALLACAACAACTDPSTAPSTQPRADPSTERRSSSSASAIPDSGTSGSERPLDASLAAHVDPLDPDQCARCHPRETASWQRSLHAQSATDPIYLAEHAPRRDPWCASCHAPEGHAIGCATCHVAEGTVVSTHASPRARHPTRVDPAMGDERACAGCHDFDFARQPGLAMQNTVDEWRASDASARGETCTDCHDPHSAPGRRDPDMAARALRVTVRAVRDGSGARITFTLRSRAGHAVPTGDLFRRLVVRAGSGASERSVILSRRFTTRDGLRVEVSDDRVPARGARTVSLRVPRAGTRVEWSIVLDALPEDRARGLMLPESAWRTELASGAARVTAE